MCTVSKIDQYKFLAETAKYTFWSIFSEWLEQNPPNFARSYATRPRITLYNRMKFATTVRSFLAFLWKAFSAHFPRNIASIITKCRYVLLHKHTIGHTKYQHQEGRGNTISRNRLGKESGRILSILHIKTHFQWVFDWNQTTVGRCR